MNGFSQDDLQAKNDEIDSQRKENGPALRRPTKRMVDPLENEVQSETQLARRLENLRQAIAVCKGHR